jgi:hypothetical protein
VLLLGDCLRLDQGVASPLLAERIAAIGWTRLLGVADELRLTSVLMAAIKNRALMPAIPAVTLPDGRMTITAGLAEREQDHVRRREALTRALDELVVALNAEAIVPVIIKGARSLWLQAPEWRSLRDIDLLVRGRAAARAQQIALRLGYDEGTEAAERRAWHHFANLYRADLPGWIEIHRRGGVPRAEQFIRTAELDATAVAMPLDGRGTARLLPPHLHILHAMVHHHVGHRGDKYGIIDLKGLYEFTAECAALDAAERDLLMARAARHPRLLAITELWIAAASEFFGMPVTDPFAIAPDAAQWWARVKGRLDVPYHLLSRDGGVEDELAAARQLARLRRAPYGKTAVGRQFWRLSIAASFIQRVSLG